MTRIIKEKMWKWNMGANAFRLKLDVPAATVKPIRYKILLKCCCLFVLDITRQDLQTLLNETMYVLSPEQGVESPQ